MKIYNYDELGLLTNESTARENPKEKGSFLIPKQSTNLKPLLKKEGFIVRFIVDKWVYEIEVISFIGQTVFNVKTKEAFTIDYQGAIKEGFTLKAPFENAIWNNSEWIKNFRVDEIFFIIDGLETYLKVLKEQQTMNNWIMNRRSEQSLSISTTFKNIRDELLKEIPLVEQEIGDLENEKNTIINSIVTGG